MEHDELSEYVLGKRRHNNSTFLNGNKSSRPRRIHTGDEDELHNS